MFRYNTTTAEFEGYFGSPAAWGAIGGGGGSGTVTEAFKTFAVSGQSSIVADGPTDTLTVAAGNNISLTTDAATDTLTIASTASGGGTVTIQRNNYTGDGSTVAYGVSSTVVSENNIQIYLDGVYQDKDTFTATGTTVTFGTAPPATTEIEIMHYVAVDGVIEVDEFVGDGTTTAFATSLSIINEDATQVYVSGVYQSKLTYQTTGNVVSFTTAPPNGANIEIVHIKALALSGFNKNNFVGTGSQTAFTLNTTVNEENMTFVFLEGIYQDKSTYGISGSTLTFATAPQNGYNVEVMVLGAISASTNALYTDTFTGDGIETDYSLGITPVDLNAIEVYLNGLYQNVGTLSLAANVVTFATPPPSGVIIEIRSVGFLNSGGTLAPATLTGGTGISVVTNAPNNFTINNTATTTLTAGTGIGIVTNSPNNFTISNTLIDVYVSWATPTGQGLTYTTPSPQSTGPFQAGSIFPTTTFTLTDPNLGTISGTAIITGLPAGITSSQSYNNTDAQNILTITLSGVYPSTNSINTNLVISGLSIAAPPVPVDFLVVAGGGGGGNGYFGGGGGGAGGLRTSFTGGSGGGGASEPFIGLYGGETLAITVGSGAASGTFSGSNSSISSSAITDIISLGGGGGQQGTLTDPGLDGGSGGGGGSTVNGIGYGQESLGGSGTNVASGDATNQGFNGQGTIGTSTSNRAGGGGGAGTVGGDTYGGTGKAVNILNTTNAATASVGQVSSGNVYYAGGGGGGQKQGAPYSNTGGLGGGGSSTIGGPPYYMNDGPGYPATPNTGGGGGGASSSSSTDPSTGQPWTGGAGGSGVVILRYPTTNSITGIGAGLIQAPGSPFTEGTDKVSVFTGGTGNITFN
jgi:hypothetical protein